MKEKLYYLFRNTSFKENFKEFFLKQGISAFLGFVLALLLTNMWSFIISLVVFVLIIVVISIVLSSNQHQFDILNILKEEQKKSNWIEIIRLGVPLSRPLWLSGRYSLRIEIGEIVKVAASRITEEIKVGSETYSSKYLLSAVLIDDLGWTRFVVGQIAKAEKSIKEGIRIAKENKLWDLAIKGNRHLIGIASKRNDVLFIEERFAEIQELLCFIEDDKEKQAISAGLLFSKAEYYFENGHLDEAFQLCEQARKTYLDICDYERYVKTFDLMGEILIRKGPESYRRAESIINEGIEAALKWQRKERYLKLIVLFIHLKTETIRLDDNYTKPEYFYDKESVELLFKQAISVGEDIQNDSFMIQLKKTYKIFLKTANKRLKGFSD